MKYTTNFYKDADNTFERYLELERAKQVIKSYNKVGSGNVLDIGPGLLPYFLYIDNYDEYTIVEPEPEFVKTYPDSIIKINSTLEEFETDKKFDFIILSSVLHLVKDVDVFLTKLRGLCHDHTLVHINVPNSKSLHRLLGVEMGLLTSLDDKSEKDKIYNHQHNFNVEDLAYTLQVRNFRIKAYDTYMVKPFADSQMTRVITREMAIGLDKLIKYLPKYGCEIAIEVKKS